MVAQRLVGHVAERGHGERPDARHLGGEVEPPHALGLAHVVRAAQHQPVEHAEDGGVGADAESDDQGHDDDEPRLGGEGPSRVAEVLAERLEAVAQPQPPLAPARRAHQTGARVGQRAEAPQRFGARLFGAEPPGFELARPLLEMRGDLLVDLGRHLLGPAQAEVELAADLGSVHACRLTPARPRGCRRSARRSAPAGASRPPGGRARAE